VRIPVSDRSPRCRLCGRLAVTLADGYCSRRCRSLADAGYVSPAHPAAALAPPTTAVEARVFIYGELPDPMPAGCAAIAVMADDRSVLRVGADDWEGLDGVIADLRDASGSGAVEIFTLQQFTAGGLVSAGTDSRRER
jgi:hypothetical protein